MIKPRIPRKYHLVVLYLIGTAVYRMVIFTVEIGSSLVRQLLTP